MDIPMANTQSSWLKPCCGRRTTVWHVFLLSAGVNSFLVACVILVVILMTVELLIDTKLLQFSNASQCSWIIHWISLSFLSMFFVETVLRIIILGIWEYIENKVEVLDGAVVILSLAPMVASTVANGPSSPWDAISLFISVRIWRVKRIIDAYVLPVKVEMEIVVQQYEKAKLLQEEQLERLTQMCQEQAFEIRQLRAHLAQQDLDLVAERERALKLPHNLQSIRTSNRFKVMANRDSDDEATENITELAHEVIMKDDMNNYIRQYYNEPSSESGVPGTCIITTAAIDVHHHPNISSDLYSAEVQFNPEQTSTSSSVSSVNVSRSPESSETLAQSISSQVFCSSTDCSTRDESTDYCPLAQSIRKTMNKTAVQELLSSFSDDSSSTHKEPANLHLSNPVGLRTSSPRHGIKIYNRVNHDGFGMFHNKSVIPLNLPLIESKQIDTELQ